MIFRHQIDDMIAKLNEAGQEVRTDTHAIYAHNDIPFDEDVYPLEVITNSDLPEGVVCIVRRKE